VLFRAKVEGAASAEGGQTYICDAQAAGAMTVAGPTTNRGPDGTQWPGLSIDAFRRGRAKTAARLLPAAGAAAST
jgi:hypothetical protein